MTLKLCTKPFELTFDLLIQTINNIFLYCVFTYILCLLCCYVNLCRVIRKLKIETRCLHTYQSRLRSKKLTIPKFKKLTLPNVGKMQNKKLSLIAGRNGKSTATVETSLALRVILNIASHNDATTMLLNTYPSDFKTYIPPKSPMEVQSSFNVPKMVCQIDILYEI